MEEVNINTAGLKDCIVIYETTEKVTYGSNGEIVDRKTFTTARKVDVEDGIERER